HGLQIQGDQTATLLQGCERLRRRPIILRRERRERGGQAETSEGRAARGGAIEPTSRRHRHASNLPYDEFQSTPAHTRRNERPPWRSPYAARRTPRVARRLSRTASSST